jgi:hypothetical protein
MIQATFKFTGENHAVIIDGNNIMFADDSGQVSTIEGIKLVKSGVVKEFPELENDPEWRRKVIERFKEKIRTMNSEIEKINYIKDEFVKFGHTALYYKRAGSRPMRFK